MELGESTYCILSTLHILSFLILKMNLGRIFILIMRKVVMREVVIVHTTKCHYDDDLVVTKQNPIFCVPQQYYLAVEF